MPGVDPSSRLDSSASRVIGAEIMHATPWLQFKHLSYVDPTGKQRAWDMVARATKKPGAVADAVCVLATLKKKDEPDDVLLVRQFRPPMGGETIELPAGLVDERESAEVTALRELEEETGYVGEVAGSNPTTPGLPLSPGLSDETVRLVRVVVDLDKVENQTKSNITLSENVSRRMVGEARWWRREATPRRRRWTPSSSTTSACTNYTTSREMVTR